MNNKQSIKRFFSVLSRAEKCFSSPAEKVKFQRRLPIFTSLQRKAQKIGIEVCIPKNITEGRKFLRQLRSLNLI
jgi:hypothetical protein